jgi:hypothetical protein
MGENHNLQEGLFQEKREVDIEINNVSSFGVTNTILFSKALTCIQLEAKELI